MRGFRRPMSRRAKLRVVAGSTVALAVFAIGFLVLRNQQAQRLADLAVVGLKALPAAAQRIEDFHRVKVKNARKVWEISAKEAQYFEEPNEIVVVEPRVSFYVKGANPGDKEEVISLRGGEGRLSLDGRNVERVSLSRGIELRFRDFVLVTEKANFDQDAEKVVAPGKVSITGDGVVLTGKRMTVEVSSERLKLHEVKTVFSPTRAVKQ